LADKICCHNSRYAEPSGYFARAGLFGQLNRSGETTFYDSVCGRPLFIAPRGRSFEAWEQESLHHGWPSFRDEEVVKENVAVRGGGEVISACGVHLGHNLPDGHGDRYW
jgi:peptide methionine sulfoxide reductase MsrB